MDGQKYSEMNRRRTRKIKLYTSVRENRSSISTRQSMVWCYLNLIILYRDLVSNTKRLSWSVKRHPNYKKFERPENILFAARDNYFSIKNDEWKNKLLGLWYTMFLPASTSFSITLLIKIPWRSRRRGTAKISKRTTMYKIDNQKSASTWLICNKRTTNQ